MTLITLLAEGTKDTIAWKHSTEDVMNGFLERTFRSRIGIRLLVEQQIMLHHNRAGYIGVICQRLAPAQTIAQCEEIAARMCRVVYGRYW